MGDDKLSHKIIIQTSGAYIDFVNLSYSDEKAHLKEQGQLFKIINS